MALSQRLGSHWDLLNQSEGLLVQFDGSRLWLGALFLNAQQWLKIIINPPSARSMVMASLLTGIFLKRQGMHALAIRFLKFFTIGLGGLTINMVSLYLLTDKAHFYYVFAALPAIQLSLLFTFCFNEIWTWKDRRSGWIGDRYLKYQLVNGVGIGINIGALFLFADRLGVHYLLANGFGAGLAAFWNFTGNHLFTWSRTTLFSRGALNFGNKSDLGSDIRSYPR